MANGHGGVRRGGGRPPKANEIALIERLSPMDDIALEVLKMRLIEGDMAAVKLFMEYRFGKPKQDLDITSAGEKITAFKIIDVDGSSI